MSRVLLRSRPSGPVLARWAFGLLLASLSSVAPAEAQQLGRWQVIPHYSTVLPVGSATTDYADEFSFRGATLDLVRIARERVRVGVSAGWHVLSDETSGTEVFPEGAFTGTVRRYVNSVPILAVGSYHFGDRWGPQPFLGAGLGTIYAGNRATSGIFTVENNNWHLGFMAQAGIALPRPGGATWTLDARYYQAVESGGIERQYVTFSLGYRIGG
ncbi:MAG: outer membrane beta-barrel protein [Gemmatimonadota bacterium]